MYTGLTKAGEIYLANRLANKLPVNFLKVKIGNGTVPHGADASETTELYSFKKEIQILDITQTDNVARIRVLIDNSDVEQGFFMKELGVYVDDNGKEKLYWYVYEDNGQYVHSKTERAIQFDLELVMEVTSSNSTILDWNKDKVWISKNYFDEKVRTFEIPTIAELQSRKNLKVGDIVEVLGYYTAGDGAGHKRIISDIDDGTGIKLSNGLYANLVKEQSAPLFYETFLKETRGFVAHRGYSLVAPENTLPAYQKAYENNIFIWETDLEMTSDGHFVLMHDGTVDRTTDGTGRVDSLTLEEVKRLNIDGGANATTIYDGTKVPTFEEWLSLAKRLNCYPFIELKRLGAEEEEIKSVVDIIKKYNMEERTAFISCEKKVLEKVRKFSFKIQVWWIADDITQDTINWCKRTGNAHLDPSWKIVTKEKVLLANSQGVNIAVWTVNDIEDAHKLFDMGVNLVASDWLSEVY